MNNGDIVKVHPYDQPERSALGLIQLISENQRSIAVAFEDSPPFLIVQGGGAAILPGVGLMLLAHREDSGPWTELFGQGKFTIEATT